MANQAILANQQPGGFTVLFPPSPFIGNQWFVNSATGVDDTAHGTSPLTPFKTINYAVTQATATNGDVIYVAPGHVETIAAAGGITLGVAGVSIVGLGVGRARPTIKYSTAATGTFLVTANNCSVTNLVFDCTGFAAVAAPVSVTTGTDFGVYGCEFIVNNATNQAVCAIKTAATANRLTVQGCLFRGTSDAGVTAAIIIVGGDGHVIGGTAPAAGNIFIGGYSSGVGAIQNVTTACTNTMVGNNTINNVTAGCTKAMVFVAGSTGQIFDNNMQILSGTAPITGAGMSWVGYNAYCATIATGTTLV